MTRKFFRQEDISLVPVELSYCPRCGTLRAQSASAGRDMCVACVRFLEWVRTGGRLPRRGRPRRTPAVKGGRA
jgi:hypothetical protein